MKRPSLQFRSFNNFLAFLTLATIMVLIGWSGASSFMKIHGKTLPVVDVFGPDYTIVKQSKNCLEIQLSDELVTGTDSACERAENIVVDFIIKGYNVTVINKGYIPISDQLIEDLRSNRINVANR